MDNKSSNIDIKSLRIGSHILVNGVRARVVRLNTVRYDKNEAFHLLVRGISPDDGVEREVGCFVDDEAVEPIAITPELLKELGFKENKTDIVKRVGGYFIFFHQINNLRWRVSLEEENCTNYGNTLCRYLHEAESFLALHGIELIPD